MVVGKQFPDMEGRDRWDFEGCTDCFGPFTFKSNLELEDSDQGSYAVKNLGDNDFDTCWAVPGGVGSWFSLSSYRISKARWPVDGFCIVNGYTKSEERWHQNSRIQELEIWIDDQVYGSVTLQDTPRVQRVRFPERWDAEAAEVRFKVLSIYPGSYYDDLCVSELQLEGGH